MKRKVARRASHRKSYKRAHPGEQYLLAVRGWMLVVAFALMLGVGAIVGNYINQQLNLASPQVAGVSTSK
jgi:hypothetical protein